LTVWPTSNVAIAQVSSSCLFPDAPPFQIIRWSVFFTYIDRCIFINLVLPTFRIAYLICTSFLQLLDKFVTYSLK
jgi:hypothetical protein